LRHTALKSRINIKADEFETLSKIRIESMALKSNTGYKCSRCAQTFTNVLDYATHLDEPCDRVETRPKGNGAECDQTAVAKFDALDDSDETNVDMKTHVEHQDDEDVLRPSVDLSRTGGYMTSRTRLVGITHLHECPALHSPNEPVLQITQIECSRP
jgi:DNA-directed RNA polymerase subunit RPC12/RpoP